MPFRPENLHLLLDTLLPPSLHPAIPLVEPYLVQSFGSFTRIDYGTGHELAFGMFLCCLSLLRFYEPTEEEERTLVLVVFLKYLEVVWKLQDVYKLEPAGSHGVWGLDDYCFLPYIWGSGQAQDHLTSRPPDVLKPPLPPTTLYNRAITRLLELKKGPFHEHSPQLYSIASSVPTWWKVNQGLFKMYDVEVLGKRVVVQHIPLGGILEWPDEDLSPTEPIVVESTAVRTPEAVRHPAPWVPSPQASPHLGSDKPLATPPPASPMSSPNMLPVLQQRSPRPRPKGGRLAGRQELIDTAAATYLPVDGPDEGEDEAEPSEGGGSHIRSPLPGPPPAAVSPVTADARILEAIKPSPSPVVEPDIAKDPLEPRPSISPKNVAKILTTEPVDHKASIPEPPTGTN